MTQILDIDNLLSTFFFFYQNSDERWRWRYASGTSCQCQNEYDTCGYDCFVWEYSKETYSSRSEAKAFALRSLANLINNGIISLIVESMHKTR
jgi:hypothetical protein